MGFIRTPHVFVLTGFLALFAFAGDIVADSIADARGDLAQQGFKVECRLAFRQASASSP
jgi:hypothetical protein